MSIKPISALIGAALALSSFAGMAVESIEPEGPVATVQSVKTQKVPVSSLVRGYGVLGTSASLTQSISLPYLSRVVRVLVTAGQVVKKGAPVIDVIADPAAVLGSAQAQNTAKDARAELARVKAQYDLRLATASQLSAAQKAVSDAQEALNAQKQTGAKPGEIIVNAPAEGTVLQIMAGQGDQIAAGSIMLQLTRRTDTAKQANVFFGIEPADAARLHVGDKVTLHSVASNMEDASASGSVVNVGQSIDPASQLVIVGANVQLDGSALMPGMHVSADVKTQPKPLWQVPAAAVLGQPDAYLFQITADGHAHRVEVKVLAEDGDQMGVDGPLDAARQVVTVGSAQIADGMSVKGATDSSASPVAPAAEAATR